MSAYPFDELLRLWAQGKLTTEQAVGQILQHVQELQKRVGRLERRLSPTRESLAPGKSKPQRRRTKK